MTDPGAPRADFFYLGQVVLRWRTAMGRSQREVADLGGPSDTTQSAIESGEWQSQKPAQTLRKIDTGLAWTEGTAKRVLFEQYDPFEHVDFVVNSETGRFEPAPPVAPPLDHDDLAPRVNGLDRQVDYLAEEVIDLRQRIESLERVIDIMIGGGPAPDADGAGGVNAVVELRKAPLAPQAEAARDTGRKGKVQKAREKQDEVGQESQDPGGMNPA